MVTDLRTENTLPQLIDLLRRAIDEQDHSYVDFDSIHRGTELAALPLDSLATVELLYSIEETFNLTIPEQAAFHFRTVGDVLQFIQAHRRDV
jgi:acyl carrier protein